MYKLLLILRYLRRKLAPMFAAAAVMLCTAMVIIVISVMGGFLQLMRQSAQKLSGEVAVYGDLTGFPHYEKLITQLRQLPEVAEATPVIKTYGLLNLHDRVQTVEVMGIKGDELSRVTGYGQGDTIHWDNAAFEKAYDERMPPRDLELDPDEREYLDQQRERVMNGLDLRGQGLRLERPQGWKPEDAPAMVLGIEVNKDNQRSPEGQYQLELGPYRSVGAEATLTVLPLTQQGGIKDQSVKTFLVINEFKSGLYDIDANRVYVPFEVLQKMLHMDEAERVDPETGEPLPGKVPARASEVLVKARPGVPLAQLDEAVSIAAMEFARQWTVPYRLNVQTWEEQHQMFLGAVEKEKGLLTILFGFISMVAVVMIAVIFYMIVLEKTRDIGVLRALGASRSGIASIFLGYGLAIGIVGSLLGTLLAWLIVTNLNEIQDVLYAWFGFKMWDPQIYYFDKIPSELDPNEVVVIIIAAILSSLVGSVIPAFLASRLDPVEALRYE